MMVLFSSCVIDAGGPQCCAAQQSLILARSLLASSSSSAASLRRNKQVLRRCELLNWQSTRWSLSHFLKRGDLSLAWPQLAHSSSIAIQNNGSQLMSADVIKRLRPFTSLAVCVTFVNTTSCHLWTLKVQVQLVRGSILKEPLQTLVVLHFFFSSKLGRLFREAGTEAFQTH